MNLNEDQLIKSAQRGDTEAFSQLALRFERRIYTLALHYTRDRHDAEDLSQEVWLKAYRAINSFRSDASFYTWLRQIMINAFLNHRRAAAGHFRREGSSLSEADASKENDEFSYLLASPLNQVEEDYERRILVESVMRSLGELTDQQRLVFLLKHREGMTYEEIAKAFGCSVGTIKKSLFRAVANLRRQLGINAAPLEYAESGAARDR